MLRAQPGSLADLAGVAGCSRQAIGNWRHGDSLPNETYRARLFQAFGIPPGAWDQQPTAPMPSSAPPAPASNTPTSIDPRTRAIELCESLRRQREAQGLAPHMLAKLASAENAALNLITRIDERAEMLEARIVREHPHWQLVKGAILEALKPHAAAMQAVKTAIEALGEKV